MFLRTLHLMHVGCLETFSVSSQDNNTQALVPFGAGTHFGNGFALLPSLVMSRNISSFQEHGNGFGKRNLDVTLSRWMAIKYQRGRF